MTNLGFSPSRWTAIGVITATIGALGASGCASAVSGNGGGGGSDTTTSSTTTSQMTGNGGSGGATTSSTSTTTTTTSTSTTSSSTSSSTSSTSSSSSTSSTGTGGAGGSGGSGGTGGTWTQPPGTADYPAEVEQNNLKSTANVFDPTTKGFTAAILPQGDVDTFEIDVTAAGSSVSIKTSNGMGGCPAGASTYVRVFDQNNTQLAGNAGLSGCASFTPATDAGLGGLAVGKYYVKIESGGIHDIPFYILEIKLSAPGCGDGLVQVTGAEQCDDGNNTDGDGCSAVCKLESGSFLDETEPNNTQDTGNLLDGFAGAVGRINPIGDADWYTFNVTIPGSSLFAETGDGYTGCPANMDTTLSLYSPSKALLVLDNNGGVSPCSKIAPAQYPAATNLPVGKYALKVERTGNATLAPFYVLKYKVSAPGCGDGILQTGEQCDDNNNTDGDGCDATCHFEKTYATETEPNDTQALANLLPAGAEGFIGAIQPAGDWDYYSFTVTTPGSWVTIRTSDGLSGCPAGFDSKLTLFDPSGTVIATNDNGGKPPCSLISPATTMAAGNLVAGTYKTRVERIGGTLTQAQYVVTIHVSPPGCGDGVVQATEQCDDFNNVNGDGCSSTCQVEAPYEIEPNDSTATATPVWPGMTTWKGSISPVGDHDYYTFTLSAPGSVTLTTHAPDDPIGCGFDTKIYLLDSNGVELAQDDDDGVTSPCSQINPMNDAAAANMPAGTYYVWVQRYMDAQAIAAYQLDLLIQ